MYYVAVNRCRLSKSTRVIFKKDKLNKTIGKDNYKIFNGINSISYRKISHGMLHGRYNLFECDVLLVFPSKKYYSMFKLSPNRFLNSNISNLITNITAFSISNMDDYVRNVEILYEKYKAVTYKKTKILSIKNYISHIATAAQPYSNAVINSDISILEDIEIEQNIDDIKKILKNLYDKMSFFVPVSDEYKSIMKKYNNQLSNISKSVYDLYENIDIIHID